MQSMIRFDVTRDVAEIVLDAPQRLNALDRAALADLAGAYAEAEAAGVRALLLRGEGRGFCAGRDIADVDPETDDVLGYLGDLERLMRRIASFPAPTFAAVHGACLGVGLGLALVTDVVYVADTAKLGSPFAGLGALLDSGAHALFVERLGAHRTLDLVFTGELMSGGDAVAAGLFSRVVAADDLLDFTRERVGRVAAGATQSFITSKRIVAGMRDATLWPVIDQETAGQESLRSTHDYREGFAAFRERRPPQFDGS